MAVSQERAAPSVTRDTTKLDTTKVREPSPYPTVANLLTEYT